MVMQEFSSSFKEEINKGYMGIFGHLDVVPAGSGWSYPPFKLLKMDKRYYGRGVLDNKGPFFFQQSMQLKF